MAQTRNYKAENERRKDAVDRENEFLKNEVIGKGIESNSDVPTQNLQSNMERSLDDSEPSVTQQNG